MHVCLSLHKCVRIKNKSKCDITKHKAHSLHSPKIRDYAAGAEAYQLILHLHSTSIPYACRFSSLLPLTPDLGEDKTFFSF